MSGDNMATKTNAVRIVQQAGIPCKEAFYEYNENAMTEGEGEDFLSYVTSHNAYLDMNGKDTFTQEVKDKCRRAYVRAEKKRKEECYND